MIAAHLKLGFNVSHEHKTKLVSLIFTRSRVAPSQSVSKPRLVLQFLISKLRLHSNYLLRLRNIIVTVSAAAGIFLCNFTLVTNLC